MLEFIKEAVSVATKIIPPAEGASDKHVRTWRLWIALATLLNAVGLSAHIALACGFAAPFYSGFAQATEVVAMREDYQKDRIGGLEASILDTRQKQCAAAAGTRGLYTSSLQKMLITYQEMTKREYPLPSCDDFK